MWKIQLEKRNESVDDLKNGAEVNEKKLNVKNKEGEMTHTALWYTCKYRNSREIA